MRRLALALLLLWCAAHVASWYSLPPRVPVPKSDPEYRR